MGITRTDGYTKKEIRLAQLAKAIGHPARVAIIGFLIKQPNCICGDIVEKLPLSQPTVSQHLRALKEVGLVKGRIEGTSICYCLDLKNWNEAKQLFESLLGQSLPISCC